MTNKMFNEKTSVLYQTRYCAQEDFSTVVCMNKIIKGVEFPFSLNNFVNSKQICSLEHLYSKIVTCGSELFVISESRQNCSFEKHSEFSKNKIVFPSLLDKRENFFI